MDQQTVQQMFDYIDGKLYWKKDCKVNKVKSKQAGCINDDGYRRIRIDKKMYQAHRIVWLYFKGVLPESIDHINGIKDDNRFENLREATHQQNNINVGLKSTNKSGYKNVCWNKKSSKWWVQLRVRGKMKYIGAFDDVELAGLVATMAREKYHGDFFNHGV